VRTAHGPEFRFDFPTRYELRSFERIPRGEYGLVLGFPGAEPLDPQLEPSAAPIIGVHPNEGEPWLGVFGATHGTTEVLSWPDERSFCVVHAGSADVVRSDEPSATFVVDADPVRQALAIPSRGLVVFADYTDLIAYRADGVAWRSGRLVWDDLEIIRAKGDLLYVCGFDPTASRGGESREFTVDLRTGVAPDKPYRDDD
jgi:hypothetical protein